MGIQFNENPFPQQMGQTYVQYFHFLPSAQKQAATIQENRIFILFDSTIHCLECMPFSRFCKGQVAASFRGQLV